jgi:hypothetical protein
LTTFKVSRTVRMIEAPSRVRTSMGLAVTRTGSSTRTIRYMSRRSGKRQ